MDDYVFNDKPSPQTILMHYGVPGMRWGVRKSRYEESDGSLNRKGKARFAKVSADERLQAKDTKQAVKALTRYRNITSKAEARAKYKAEMNKGVSRDKYKKYSQRGAEFARRRQIYDQNLKSISSGKMKAGRDFVYENNNVRNFLLYETIGVFSIPLMRSSNIVLKNKAK